MILKEFVKHFIMPNSLIRLVKRNGGNYEVLEGDWDNVLMDHELLESTNTIKFQKYINCEVLGVVDILILNNYYVEAINICINV